MLLKSYHWIQDEMEAILAPAAALTLGRSSS
jgi:hypothetical protein